MHKIPFIQHLKVYRWKSLTEKELYILGTDNTNNGIHIPQTIYKDHSIEDAVFRIGTYIQKNVDDTFYIWVKNEPLLFSINDIKWRGYNVNPFKSVDHTSPSLNEPVSYTYRQGLFGNHNNINIVFSKDLPKELQQNKYYFSEVKGNKYDFYKKHDDKLALLRDLTVTNVSVSSENFIQIHLYAQLKDIFLADIFDKVHSSKHIDMIQWINDPSKIMYKLYKKHKIRPELVRQLTNIDRITKINVINMFSILSKTGYCKVSVDHTGEIIFNYIFDSRSPAKLSDISAHKSTLVKLLQNVFKQSIVLKYRSLNANIKFEVHNSAFKLLTKKISENIDIFHIVKPPEMNKAKMLLTTIYKRSTNYGQNTNIYDYIRSRINIGVTKQELVNEILNLGITDNIDDMINDELNAMSMETEIKEKNKVNLQNNGTIVLFEPISQGYNVLILNCPNYEEIQYLKYWLSRILSISIDHKAKQVIPVVPVIPPQISPRPETPLSPESISFDDDSIDFDMDIAGGAAKHNYLISMLQQADKDLFGENYARDKCQSAFQPVVFSKEYKDNLEKNNQLHFDNIIEYGSSSGNMNHYACPRLWCPQSKVPLDVNDANAKCPLDNEEPMQMFWNNDKNKKRYVKLIKPNERGVCVPCCMKKEPKNDEIRKCKAFLEPIQEAPNDRSSPLPDTKTKQAVYNDENYIMHQNAPIPVGRYASVPEYLHKIFSKDSYTVCTKTLTKTNTCLLRRGIRNSKYNSIVYAVSYLLGFKSKKEFTQDIQKRLDILTFISLDNGYICKQFMSMREIIPKDNAKLVKQYNSYIRNKDITTGNLSRMLNIYYAYTRFIDYISSNEYAMDKMPQYLYALVNRLYDITMIVWEKKDNVLYFQCPLYTNINVDMNPVVTMLLKDGKHYEPLEFKIRSTPGVKLLQLKEYPKLEEIMLKCPFSDYVASDMLTTYKHLYSLQNWIKSRVLNNSNKFRIKKILINSDLSISNVLTKGNILLFFPTISISLLPNMMKEFGVKNKNVIFYDDITAKKFNVNVLKNDLDMFSQKCNDLSIKFLLGEIRANNSTEYNAILTIPDDHPIASGPILHTYDTSNAFYQHVENSTKKSKEWYELKKMVINRIINKYRTDDQLAVLNQKKRTDKIVQLLTLFDSKHPLKKIRIILEELSLINSINGLKKALVVSYNYNDSTVQEKKNEFLFSQNALINNGSKVIPDFLLYYHKALPNIRNQSTNIIDIQLSNTVNIEPTKSLSRPPMFDGKFEKLGSKWILHKKSKWLNMVYIKTVYDKSMIQSFVEWLSAKLGLMVTYDDVLNSTKQKYFAILNDKDTMFEILQDSAYFNRWQQVCKKSYITVQLFWDKFYNKLTPLERQKYAAEVLSDLANMYSTDLTILSVSELFNISILTLHRGKYGKFDANEGRGELNDLLLSSTLYSAKENMAQRPLIILNKINEKVCSAYYLVVETAQPDTIYVKYADAPANIKMLVDAHLAQ
jgi:hypothetical protein